jgi:hypothetical protein
LGFVDDFWFHYVGNVGNAGPDKGKGGKFLRRWLVSVRNTPPRLWIPRVKLWMGARRTKFTCRPTFPAKNFWAFVLYDNQTRSMLQTDARLPSIGSQKLGLVINPDTSVDVYFGPTPPAGHEANWAQTVPGKGWNVLFRLYGPLQPWFDKTRKPGEFELAN